MKKSLSKDVNNHFQKGYEKKKGRLNESAFLYEKKFSTCHQHMYQFKTVNQ